MEYQIVSTLPTITSQATALSTYNFYDTLCEGLAYDKDAGVTVAFFTDAACTDKVATWSQDSGKFTVTYSEDGRHMTVDIAKAGLEEINGATANKNGKLYTGYSNYTARVTYSAVINADKTFAYGEKGNENTVVLTWNVYTKDVLGVLQNDPHYSFDGGEDLKLANIPQRALSHNYPTASATVDKNEVTMLEDNGSANAEVPLTVKNTKGFDLPKTGDHGTWMYSLVGILLMSAAAGVIVLTARKKHGR